MTGLLDTPGGKRGMAAAEEALQALDRSEKPKPVDFTEGALPIVKDATPNKATWFGRGLRVEIGDRAFGYLQMERQLGYPVALAELEDSEG